MSTQTYTPIRGRFSGEFSQILIDYALSLTWGGFGFFVIPLNVFFFFVYIYIYCMVRVVGEGHIIVGRPVN